jgi:hypothetical protein
VPTLMSHRWVTKKEWSATSNIALGQMQTIHKYKWWTKNVSSCHWISVLSVNFALSTQDCKAGSWIEIHAKAQENRLTTLK